MSKAMGSPAEVLVELAEEREQARAEVLDAEPDTPEHAAAQGREYGLRDALQAFEQLEEFEQHRHLPEWQIALENEDGDWDWYYPHAVTRETAIEKAKTEARDDLGEPLNAYEVSGPIAES